ncbi:hypothetical protein QQM79_02900 [Marinobacteraceae bacterium S3BR75-40.1]
MPRTIRWSMSLAAVFTLSSTLAFASGGLADRKTDQQAVTPHQTHIHQIATANRTDPVSGGENKAERLRIAKESKATAIEHSYLGADIPDSNMNAYERMRYLFY